MKRALKWIFGVAALLLLAGAGLLWWGVRVRFPPEPALPGSLRAASMEHDGRTRTWREYVPSKLADSPALVLVFHGSTGNGEQARRHYGYEWDLLAEEHGFVVVYPDGFEGHWNDCRVQATYSARTQHIDDVGFVRALIDRHVEERKIDRGRVYATGFSNGGHMCYRLAMEAPELVRAIGPVAASFPAQDNCDCRQSHKPVNVCIINGTKDPMNPWGGGNVALWGVFGNRGPVLSAEESALHFVRLAGLPEKGGILPLIVMDESDGCSSTITTWAAEGKKQVVLIGVHGGGHAVPHPQIHGYRLLGAWSRDFSAARELYTFFKQAP
jgi:polyhydroxybutyrate depolymerase